MNDHVPISGGSSPAGCSLIVGKPLAGSSRCGVSVVKRRCDTGPLSRMEENRLPRLTNPARGSAASLRDRELVLIFPVRHEDSPLLSPAVQGSLFPAGPFTTKQLISLFCSGTNKENKRNSWCYSIIHPCMHFHPLIPGSGCGGSRPSRLTQTSLSPATAHLGDPEAFTGQPGDIIPPVCPGPYPGSPPIIL